MNNAICIDGDIYIMTFEEFKKKIRLLNDTEAEDIRKKYIHKFINMNAEGYHLQIESLHKFVDGYCYEGYLWDYIKNPIIIDDNYIRYIAQKNHDYVFVFWDIHSCERILIKDYWKFGKNTVIKLKLSDLIEGYRYLPEDIYIFDKSMSWTLIKTHEEIGDSPYVIKSGDI